MKIAEKETVLIKIYDLLLYIIPLLAKFPRDQKFLLADRIENQILDTQEEAKEKAKEARKKAKEEAEAKAEAKAKQKIIEC